MATFRSFGDFERELGRWQREMEREGRRKITRAQGQRMQEIATRVASGDLGGDPKFSGWAPPLDTQLKDLRNGDTLLTPTRVSAGPWTVAQSGRNQGNASGFAGPGAGRRTGRTRRRKDGSLAKVRRFSARRWNGTTKGKGTADKTIEATEREVEQIAEGEFKRVTRKHFDVS